ncbi:MAG: hypothetical protein R6U50_03800 [Desulfobacterales bacterium]
MVRPWINVLAGAWAFFSAFWYYMLQPINFFILGVIIAIFGFWTYRKEWQGIVNGIIGLWLILSAFVPSLIAQWNLLISGLVVIALAVWRMFRTRRPRPVAG